MKAVRFILRILLGTVSTILLVAILIVASVLVLPNWWVNRTTVDLALTFVRAAGVDIYLSEDATVEAHSVSLFRKRIALKSSRVCFSVTDPVLGGCFNPVHIEAQVNLFAFPPELTRIPVVKLGQGKVLKKHIRLDADLSMPPAKVEAPPADARESISNIVSMVEKFRPRELDVEMKSFRWEEEKGAWVASGRFKGDKKVLDLTVAGKHEGKDFPLDVNVRLVMNEDEGKIDAKVKGLTPQLEQVELRDCNFHWKRADEELSDISTSVNCPILGKWKLVGKQKTLLREWTGETIVVVRGKGNVKPRKNELAGDWRVEIQPTGTKVVRGQIAAELSYSGKLSAADEIANWKSRVSGELSVSSYDKLVLLTDGIGYPIPSPLRTLKGDLNLTLAGEGKQIGIAKGEMPFALKTELRSPMQRVPLNIDGSLTWEQLKDVWKLHLALNADLSNLQLRLPDLNPTDLPRLVPDPRIVLDPPSREPAATTTDFTYAITIKTGPEAPVRLLTNLGKQPIPLELGLKITSERPIAGVIKVLPVTFEIFRRNGSLKNFVVSFMGTDEPLRLDGKIDVNSGDYLIHILVSGPVDAPRVAFESEPPLSQDDALSVLLFGRTNDELSTNQGDSVANTRAAISNRALSLASMYLLASTPLETVLYDPTTKTMSARVKLGDGTTMQIGGDFQTVQELGVRRRLGSNWFINTYLKNPFESSEKRSVTSFLEWMSRY